MRGAPRWIGLAVAAGLALPALAQGVAVPEGVAPQVIAVDPEPGGVVLSAGGGGGPAGGASGQPAPWQPHRGRASGGGAGAVTTAAGGGATATGEYETAHLATLARQPYGAVAIEDAQAVGVNPNTTAAFANAESRFRNVPAANGSTSANGIWQITDGAWGDTVARNGLEGMDRADPADQAVVANRVIRQYAAATQNAIGREATTADAYGSYVFGPSVGGRLASADDATPMLNVVPAQSLRNNGMASWSVGQWRTHSRTVLGPAAGQAALTR